MPLVALTASAARRTAAAGALLVLSLAAPLAVSLSGCGGTFGGSSPPVAPETGTFVFPAAAPVVRDRVRHTATTLDNNDVLVVGGDSAVVGGPVAQAEVYRPVSQNFLATNGLLARARRAHTATRLPDDTVLIAGGEDQAGVISEAEVWNRHSGLFTGATGASMTARRNHSATLMMDGSVLIAGGDPQGAPLASIERFTTGNGFASNGSLLQARTRHVALRRENNDILVAGGFVNAGLTVPTATVEILDRNSGLPRAAARSLAQPRAGAGATFLASGHILIAGGFGVGAAPLDTAEIYDPKSERPVRSLTMTRVRGSARVARLFDGRVLVVGDDATADIFDPFSGDFVKAASNLTFVRNGHSLTALSTAEILIFGGASAANNGGAAELFDPR